MYIYLGVIAVTSLLTLFFYGVDKLKAKSGAWRIKESTLLLLGLFGGAVGALLGMTLFRHKTKKAYFYIVNIIALLLQIAVGLWLY